jgi:ubiquinone/menaquinone biosynthesis C-methylase UbiE
VHGALGALHGARDFTRERAAYWDRIVGDGGPRFWSRGYHQRLAEIYKFLIPAGKRVLELGSGSGDLLAALKPSVGVGIDLSSKRVQQASAKHPHLSFIHGDAHDLSLPQQQFDFVVLSDLINELWDVQHVFELIRAVCHRRTRLIINTYSRAWDLPLRVARGLQLAQPTLDQNWFTVQDTENLLRLAGFEPMRAWPEVLWPIKTPVIEPLYNKYFAKIWPLRHLALSNFIMARPAAGTEEQTPAYKVSVVVPARNEAGNIGAILDRTPEMGAGVELVFVEGHSSDDTWQVIQDEVARRPEKNCVLLQQTGRGKGDAVRLGFQKATGDILMILDADMTVPPEDLPRFCDALIQGHADFVNGVRLVYPMENNAMRPLNLVGNKFFSLVFSWLLDQPIKDTLCGTKVMFAEDYRAIAANRAKLGDFDPFGDFDLIFGAAMLNMRIVDMPVRYRERTYGETNIQRFRHGWMLLQMVAFAARRIKFT